MLIDDLINLKEAKSDNLDKVLMEALRFQVDNVAKYHYESMPRSYQDHEKRGRYRLEEHIPNLAPLANVMWFEYSGPSVGLPPFDRCGCLVCVVYEREYWQEHKPVFTFHTIDIEPSKQVLRTEGHISENGLARALHICRGHFAHYTAEKPLFGKYTGTFYRPMHIRGTAEQGISVKDYRVHPQ